MEVILKEDYPSLGYIGDRVKVRPGFGRNFLIPRGMAVEASSRNANLLKHQLEGIKVKRMKRRADAEEYAKSLAGLVLEFTLKQGEQGKSFGSITARDAEQALKGHGVTVDRKQVRLVDPIRGVGSYKIEVKLHAEVIVPITVRVLAEKPVVSAVASDEPKEGKKRGKKKSAAEDEAPAETEAVEADA